MKSHDRICDCAQSALRCGSSRCAKHYRIHGPGGFLATRFFVPELLSPPTTAKHFERARGLNSSLSWVTARRNLKKRFYGLNSSATAARSSRQSSAYDCAKRMNSWPSSAQWSSPAVMVVESIPHTSYLIPPPPCLPLLSERPSSAATRSPVGWNSLRRTSTSSAR